MYAAGRSSPAAPGPHVANESYDDAIDRRLLVDGDRLEPAILREEQRVPAAKMEALDRNFIAVASDNDVAILRIIRRKSHDDVAVEDPHAGHALSLDTKREGRAAPNPSSRDRELALNVFDREDWSPGGHTAD